MRSHTQPRLPEQTKLLLLLLVVLLLVVLLQCDSPCTVGPGRVEAGVWLQALGGAVGHAWAGGVIHRGRPLQII